LHELPRKKGQNDDESRPFSAVSFDFEIMVRGVGVCCTSNYYVPHVWREMQFKEGQSFRTSQSFPTQHDDVVHDLAYDFYGRRLATCSSDQKIKVWDLDENGDWMLSAEWKVCSPFEQVISFAQFFSSFQAHSGSVWQLDWAHPEFGQVLASCSYDRQVTIWEETGMNFGGVGGIDSRSQPEAIVFCREGKVGQ
jgi:WD40 repeat protein